MSRKRYEPEKISLKFRIKPVKGRKSRWLAGFFALTLPVEVCSIILAVPKRDTYGVCSTEALERLSSGEIAWSSYF